MPLLQNNESYTIRGTLDLTSGTTTFKSGSISRSTLSQEVLAEVGIPVTDLRTWDDLTAFLPGTAATDDLAIIEGTWGTDNPTAQSSDGKATTITQYARLPGLVVGNEFDTGETMQLRVRGGMITTVSDGTATVDVEAYVNDGDGGVGSDLCTTAAQSINSLTKANRDFTIDTSSLAHGDIIDIRLTVAITDTATATAVIGEISKITLLRDVKG